MTKFRAVGGSCWLEINSLIVVLTIFWLASVRSFSVRTEFGVGKLPGGFLFVKVGTPYNDGAAFVGWFDGDVLTIAK